MGTTKDTTAKNDVTKTAQITWDEHIFIESGKVKAKEIEEALIEI